MNASTIDITDDKFLNQTGVIYIYISIKKNEKKYTTLSAQFQIPN